MKPCLIGIRSLWLGGAHTGINKGRVLVPSLEETNGIIAGVHVSCVCVWHPLRNYKIPIHCTFFFLTFFFFFFFEYYFYTCKRLLLSLYKGRTCQLCQYAQPSICSIIQYQCQSFFDTKGLSLPFFWQTFWVCKKAELVEHKQRLHLIE